jgi:hypothetical protein
MSPYELRATVTCGQCDWMAERRADNEQALHQALQEALEAHRQERHSDGPEDGA